MRREMLYVFHTLFEGKDKWLVAAILHGPGRLRQVATSWEGHCSSSAR